MSECYCAQVQNNVVVRVIVCDSDEWASSNLSGEWMCTGERLVGVGYIYREDLQVLVPPQPYSSWILNTVSLEWEPPVQMPQGGGPYRWDDDAKAWVAIAGQ